MNHVDHIVVISLNLEAFVHVTTAWAVALTRLELSCLIALK